MIILICSILIVPAAMAEYPLFINLQDSQVLHKIISEMIAKTKIYNTAIFISEFSSTKNFIIDDITKHTMYNKVPMSCVVSSVASAKRLWPSCRINSRTLLLHIYMSKDLSNFMKIQDISYILVYGKFHPKVLFVAILEEAEADFQALFSYMWSKSILDVTVLEVSKTNESLAFTVHQYNPFSTNYSSQPYSPPVDWFPNKLSNLYGYPIKVDLLLRPGYNLLYRNSQGFVIKYRGHDSRAMETIKRAMNFSTIIIAGHDDFRTHRIRNASAANLVSKIQARHAEIMFTTLPMNEGMYNLTILTMTEAYTSEKWCVLMPILYKKSPFEYDRLLRIIVSLIIITIFWLVSIILRFESELWRILNIFGIIISASVPEFKLSSWPERILFVSLILVSAVYSSSLYADLMTSNIGGREEIPVENYRDLLRHGLKPTFHKEVHKINFKYAEGDFMALKSKSATINSMIDCGEKLLKHGNISCFIEINVGTAVMAINWRSLQRPVKINEKLCYWSPQNGFYVYKYSPYTRPIGNLMLRFQEAGLSKKWFMDYFNDISSGSYGQSDNKRRDFDDTAGLEKKIFIILVFGYSLSIVAFFGELIIHCLKRRCKLK